MAVLGCLADSHSLKIANVLGPGSNVWPSGSQIVLLINILSYLKGKLTSVTYSTSQCLVLNSYKFLGEWSP